jgi:polysaccharide biosynthesis protein VpsM
MRMRWFIGVKGLIFFSLLGLASVAFAADAPTGQVSLSGDVFGTEGGWVHPFLGVTTGYTDNVFYTDTDEKDDTFFVITPGIWFAMPGSKTPLVEMDTAPTNPGGVDIGRPAPKRERQYQAYLLYSPEFELYSKYDDENQTSQRADGFFQYNFGGRFSIDLLDQARDSYESRSDNIDNQNQKYKSNSFHAIGRYDISEKFRLQADFFNFVVNFDEAEDEFRDRVDNGAAAYVFYHLSTKTSLFTNYEFRSIQYDEDIQSDSDQHSVYVGVDWEITEKTTGRVKAGYGIKDYDRESLDDDETFAFETILNYILSPKTEIDLTAMRRFSETDDSQANGIITTRIGIDYLQRFTAKLSASVSVFWTRDDYQGDVTVLDETKSLEEDTFKITPSFTWEPRDWIKVSIGYQFATRDSSFEIYDYDCNTVFFTIAAAF